MNLSWSRNQKGFSLLEVLVATLVSGIGILAIMTLFNKGFLSVGEVEDYSLALSLAQEKMEELKGASYASISSSSKAVVSGFSQIQRQVVVATPLPNLKQVAVTTYWQVPDGEKNLTLTTYIVNN